MLRCFPIIFSLLLISLVLPAVVWAKGAVISASAELRYADQTVETAGVKTLDANHFIQQYSFLWTKEGKLSRGRMGKYDLALGYEWSWVDSEINGQQVQVENPLDKILFRGDLTLAPGGLPFRLHVFSYDMQRTSFTSNDLGFLFRNDTRNAVRSGIVDDINNGSHVTTGLTLEAGVQNGHYGGRYRDLLSTLPRLLIDYKQEEIRDVKGPNPRDYVDRDLAFVSLNKKNNWFHYRRYEHKDNIDSAQNRSEDTFLLGTVDHTSRRQWVNLTNWISVSADISYNEQRSNSNVSGRDNFKRYDLNLFAKARRTRWQLDNFTTFRRELTDSRLERYLDIPFYARGELNRDTAWRFQMESSQYQDNLFVTSSERKRDNLYMRGQVETYRQARYILRPQLELESKSGSEGEGLGGRVRLELFNNPLYRTDNEMFAGYSAALLSGTGTGGVDAFFVEQNVQVRLENQLSSLYRIGGSQEFVYGTGTYDTSVSEHIYSDLAGVATFNDGSGSFSDDLLRSISSVFIEVTPHSKLRNRVELSYELIDSSLVAGGQFSLDHRLDYTNKAFAMDWTNRFVTGDGLPGSGLTAGSVGSSALGPYATTEIDFSDSLVSTLHLSYAPGRSSRFRMKLAYEAFHYAGGADAERIEAEESYEYTLWHINGRVRKLLVLGEVIEYDKDSSFSGGALNLLAFSLFSNYYPTAHTLLSARIRYEQDDVADTETLLSFLSVGVNYQKLQVSLDYSYGRRADTDTSPEVLEQKWEVQVKKTF